MNEAPISFPDTSHVRGVCRPGKNQCRFLLEDAEGYSCGLNSQTPTPGKNQSGSINCNGFLEKVDENKAILVGSAAVYKDPPFLEAEGKLVEIQGSQIIRLRLDTEMLGPLDPYYVYPRVVLARDGVTFGPQHYPHQFSESVKVLTPVQTHVKLPKPSLRERLRALLPF